MATFTKEQQAAIDRASAKTEKGDAIAITLAGLEESALASLPEDRRKQETAIRKARAKASKSAIEAEESARVGFGGQLLKSIAGIAGAPVDITNFLTSKIGFDEGPEPLGGSVSIAKAFEAFGAPVATEPAETFLGKSGEVAGEAMGFALPFAKTAQLAARGGGAIGALGKSVTREIVERPLQSLAIEAAAVPGVAGARMLSEKEEFGPGAQMLAETVGGLTPIAALKVATLPMRTATSLGAKALIPFTKSGAEVRASRRVQELVADPQKSAQLIDDLRSTELSPAARTGEPGLLALEEAVVRQSPVDRAAVTQSRSEAMNKLSESIKKSGSAEDLKSFTAARRDRLSNAITARIETAGDQAGRNLEAILPADGPEANIIVRESLEKALADAKIQEEMLWSAVPSSTPTPVKNITKAFTEISATIPAAQADDIPEVARRIIGETLEKDAPKIEFTELKELDGLFKRLGEDAATARAAGQFNKARIAEELRSAILKDYDAIKAPGQIGEKIKTARDFSRQVKEKFNKGPVGKLMGFAREGGQKVPTELTLPTTIGAGKERGIVGLKALKAAAPEDPNVLEGVSEFLKAEFVRTAIDPTTGRVKPGSFDAFTRKFNGVLDSIPATKEQLFAARTSEDALRRVEKSGDSMRKALDRKSVSATARLLNAPVDQEIAKIMTGPEPEKALRGIVNLAKKDKSGKSFDGLRAGVSEFLVDSLTSPSAIDQAGNPLINGARLSRILDDPGVSKSLKLVFNEKEMKNLADTATQMSLLQKQIAQRGDIEIIADRPGWILEKMGQVLGAKIGAKMSSTAGGSIQSANIGSTAARDFLNSITADKARQMLQDAVQDPKLMKALLTHRNATVSKSQERVIRNYMASVVGSRLSDELSVEKANKEKSEEK